MYVCSISDGRNEVYIEHALMLMELPAELAPHNCEVHVHQAATAEEGLAAFLAGEPAADDVFAAMPATASGTRFLVRAATGAHPYTLAMHPVTHIDWASAEAGGPPHGWVHGPQDWAAQVGGGYARLREPLAAPPLIFAAHAWVLRGRAPFWARPLAAPAVDAEAPCAVMAKLAFAGSVGWRTIERLR